MARMESDISGQNSPTTSSSFLRANWVSCTFSCNSWVQVRVGVQVQGQMQVHVEVEVEEQVDLPTRRCPARHRASP